MNTDLADQTIELRIIGMTCASCADHITHALENVPEVRHVEVPGWEAGRAIVGGTSKMTLISLTDAVAQVGYRAVIVRPPLTNARAAHTDEGPSDFDLLVIGGGSGGFAAAITASEMGKRVAMINAGEIGGTCVNVGCVPSKTLIRAAEAWHKAGNHPFKGVYIDQVNLDWSMIRAEKDTLVAGLRQSKYIDVLAAYPDIAYIDGEASFQPNGSVQVGQRSYRAARVVIATGARPRVLPFPGVDTVQPLDSTTLMDLDELPKSLIVLGGRAVALEMAQMMARFGVRVTILQRSDRLVPDHEPEVSKAIQDCLQEDGIEVVTGVQVEHLSRDGDARVIQVQLLGQTGEFRAAQVLMALGRRPNTAGLGLELVGVEIDTFGAILVNEYQQTTNPRIFATGDVTTRPDYVYLAAAGGALAARNALGETRHALDLSAVPGVIFTDPQIATVGLTETKARETGYDIMSKTIGLGQVPRARAARDTRGLIKLVADAQTGRLLGAHILAAEAGEVIQTAVLAIRYGLTLDDIADTFFPYLVQVEGLKLAALSFHKDVNKLSCCAV